MMKEIKLTNDQIKDVQLNMLRWLDAFCREHALTYFINYGTLIGAVRHQGFIPWDDDIDLMMPRPDYERFIQVFQSQKQPYHLLDWRYDTVYFNNFIKIIDPTTRIDDLRNDKTYQSGVFIDIFPYDQFDDLKVVEKTYNWESFKLLSFSKLHNIIYQDSWVKDLIRASSWLLLRPVKPQWFARKIDQIIQQLTVRYGQYEGLLASKFKHKEVFPAGTYASLTELTFEGIQVKAPADYHRILTQLYGDYLSLPPVEQQVNPHELVVYQRVEEEA